MLCSSSTSFADTIKIEIFEKLKLQFEQLQNPNRWRYNQICKYIWILSVILLRRTVGTWKCDLRWLFSGRVWVYIQGNFKSFGENGTYGPIMWLLGCDGPLLINLGLITMAQSFHLTLGPFSSDDLKIKIGYSYFLVTNYW